MSTTSVLESTTPLGAAAALERLEPSSRDVAEFLPSVAHEPSQRFDRRLHANLECSVADTSSVHRPSRHAPLASSGEYQVMGWIYTDQRDWIAL